MELEFQGYAQTWGLQTSIPTSMSRAKLKHLIYLGGYFLLPGNPGLGASSWQLQDILQVSAEYLIM